MAADSEHPQPASEHLFLRNATGLVREVRPLSSLVINYIVGSPVQVLGAGLFFALSLYPGGNLYLGLAIILPMMLAYSYTFGLMTAAVPRSGGDYTIVSRVLHPTLGVISSVFMLLAQFMSVAFFGIAFVTTGVVPGLTALDTSAQIPAWALLFGYAQQVFTRLADQQGNVLTSVRGRTDLKPIPPRRKSYAPGRELPQRRHLCEP